MKELLIAVWLLLVAIGSIATLMMMPVYHVAPVLCFFGAHSPTWRHPDTGIFLHSYVSGYTEIKCDYCDKKLT